MDSYNNRFFSLHSKSKSDQLFKTRLSDSHFIFSNPLLEHATKIELKKETLVNSYFLKALGKESKLFQLIKKNNKSNNHPLQLIVRNSNKSTKNIKKKTSYPFIYINNNKSLSRTNSFYHKSSKSHPFYDLSPKITSTKNKIMSPKTRIKLLKTRKKEFL